MRLLPANPLFRVSGAILVTVSQWLFKTKYHTLADLLEAAISNFTPPEDNVGKEGFKPTDPPSPSMRLRIEGYLCPARAE